MREYIITAAIGAIIASVADIMAPEGWKGYVRIGAGFLILALLISPISQIKNAELFYMPQQGELNGMSLKNSILDEFQKNVEKDIEERLISEFGVSGDVAVEIDVDEEYNIRGVEEINIKTEKIPDGLEERLRNVYGCERIQFE